jgi:splicing factor 3B subunit 3
MDFGMNTVIRKKELPVDPTAHMLIPVPNLPDGPGGLLVVLEDYLLYKNHKEEHLIRFPVRNNRETNRKLQFTSYATYKLKGFFFLISSEEGDIFKIEFLTT